MMTVNINSISNKMERREYNEVYGFLPKDIINKLSNEDRIKLFAEFIFRKPTSTGWFITNTVIKELGDGFINYIINGIIEALMMDEIEITKDTVLNILASTIESFATDSNILEEQVRLYRKEVLGIDDSDIPDSKNQTENIIEKKEQMPSRDSKGRFIKSKK